MAQNAAGAQALPVPNKSGASEESSGSGSGDSSGSGDAPEGKDNVCIKVSEN